MEKLEILKNKKSSELTADDIFFLQNKEIINGCGARVIRNENCENFLRNIFAKISQILVKIIRPRILRSIVGFARLRLLEGLRGGEAERMRQKILGKNSGRYRKYAGKFF